MGLLRGFHAKGSIGAIIFGPRPIGPRTSSVVAARMDRLMSHAGWPAPWRSPARSTMLSHKRDRSLSLLSMMRLGGYGRFIGGGDFRPKADLTAIFTWSVIRRQTGRPTRCHARSASSMQTRSVSLSHRKDLTERSVFIRASFFMLRAERTSRRSWGSSKDARCARRGSGRGRSHSPCPPSLATSPASRP